MDIREQAIAKIIDSLVDDSSWSQIKRKIAEAFDSGREFGFEEGRIAESDAESFRRSGQPD